MRSYRDLAEEAGVTVEAVRDAMGRAERHEIPYTRMYDDFRNPPRPTPPAIGSTAWTGRIWTPPPIACSKPPA